MKGISMRIFLKKDIAKVGMAGEIIKVSDGYARNFLFPKDLAVEITPQNEQFYQKQLKEVEHRKEVISSQTSMLGERISSIILKLKRKMHDDGKLYGAINQSEIVDALANEGISVSKNQVLFGKSIKNKGTHEATIKLTSRLQPRIKIVVLPE
jgi:large subunit ribosomal protein L9